MEGGPRNGRNSGSLHRKNSRLHLPRVPQTDPHGSSVAPVPYFRRRWPVLVAAALAIIVIAASAFILLRNFQRQPADQGPFPTVLTFTHNPIACPAAAAWSPDAALVAVVGFTACPLNQAYPASGPASNVALTTYDARNGQPLQTTDLGQPITIQALPPNVRGNSTATSQAQVLIGALLWSAHTHQLSLSITTFYDDPNGNGQPVIYDSALVLVPDQGAPRVLSTPGSPSSGPFAGSAATSLAPFQVTRWDLSTGSASVISVPQALAYTWGSNSTLNASLPLPAAPGVTVPTVAVAAIGDPGGDISFSAWQRGSVGFGLVCGGNNSAACCVDTTHLTATVGSPIAWSPDGRYVLVPESGILAGGAVGQFPAPPVNATNVPGACAGASSSNQFTALPIRDAGLASGLRAFDLTRVGLVVAWSPDGQRIAVRADHSLSGSAHELSIFDCRSGKLIGSFSAQQIQHGLPAGRGSSTQVSIGLPPIWSPDSTHLLVLDNDLRVISILGPNMLDQ